MHSASLASSMGWPLTGPMPDPQTGAVVVLAEVGDERRQHQDDRDEEQQVAVAVEVARPAHDDQGDDVGAHPHRRPPCLGLGPVLGDAGEHHVAEPVQQCGDGQEHGVGVRRVDPVGDVRGEPEPEHDAQERPQVGGDLRRGADRGEDVGGHDDEGAEEQQSELGSSSGLGSTDPHPLAWARGD